MQIWKKATKEEEQEEMKLGVALHAMKYLEYGLLLHSDYCTLPFENIKALIHYASFPLGSEID